MFPWWVSCLNNTTIMTVDNTNYLLIPEGGDLTLPEGDLIIP